MEPEGRRQLLLLALVVVLVVVTYELWPRTSEAPASSAGSGRVATGQAQADRATSQVPDVRLHALENERPTPAPASRNLFRFKPKPPPPPLSPPPDVAPPVAAVPVGPPQPPPLPPIPLKFIGVFEQQSKKFAVLSDGRGGTPIVGTEGQTVLGQYRILRIGVESIEISYLDGRGRQTIRLTGS